VQTAVLTQHDYQIQNRQDARGHERDCKEEKPGPGELIGFSELFALKVVHA
jgi:hypothetical protein